MSYEPIQTWRQRLIREHAPRRWRQRSQAFLLSTGPLFWVGAFIGKIGAYVLELQVAEENILIWGAALLSVGISHGIRSFKQTTAQKHLHQWLLSRLAAGEKLSPANLSQREFIPNAPSPAETDHQPTALPPTPASTADILIPYRPSDLDIAHALHSFVEQGQLIEEFDYDAMRYSLTPTDGPRSHHALYATSFSGNLDEEIYQAIQEARAKNPALPALSPSEAALFPAPHAPSAPHTSTTPPTQLFTPPIPPNHYYGQIILFGLALLFWFIHLSLMPDASHAPGLTETLAPLSLSALLLLSPALLTFFGRRRHTKALYDSLRQSREDSLARLVCEGVANATTPPDEAALIHHLSPWAPSEISDGITYARQRQWLEDAPHGQKLILTPLGQLRLEDDLHSLAQQWHPATKLHQTRTLPDRTAPTLSLLTLSFVASLVWYFAYAALFIGFSNPLGPDDDLKRLLWIAVPLIPLILNPILFAQEQKLKALGEAQNRHFHLSGQLISHLQTRPPTTFPALIRELGLPTLELIPSLSLAIERQFVHSFDADDGPPTYQSSVSILSHESALADFEQALLSDIFPSAPPPP